MSHRKAIESEIARYDMLATRLECNLKNVAQSLVADRNHYKTQDKENGKQLSELKTQNVKLETINGCLEDRQKTFEKYVFKGHDQSFITKSIIEAASQYAGDRASEPGSEHQTTRSNNASAAHNYPSVAENDVVNLVEEDERHIDRESNHE